MVPFCDVTLYPQGAEKGDIDNKLRWLIVTSRQ